MITFARTFMQANPLYLNVEYARAHGHPDLPTSPQMVFNIVLSLGVQNDSEKAIANLGYYDVAFLAPVYPEDTLMAATRVADRQDRGPDKPGIVTLETVGWKQDGTPVLQYRRKIMVAHAQPGATPAPTYEDRTGFFPWNHVPVASIPAFGKPDPAPGVANATAGTTAFEDFTPGEIIVHANGRSITDEHLALTYAVGNSHPLHFDRVFSSALTGKMAGEPIVYGGLVFAWLEGLASRDVSENAMWELGFTEGYHTQPAVSGDTVAAISRILAVEPAPPPFEAVAGVVTSQLIGVKGISATEAVESYGEALFIKENDKRKRNLDKIPAKIFEIERRLLVKKRASIA
jgi:2-methylfumaryl-CoA hydratase